MEGAVTWLFTLETNAKNKNIYTYNECGPGGRAVWCVHSEGLHTNCNQTARPDNQQRTELLMQVFGKEQFIRCSGTADKPPNFTGSLSDQLSLFHVG